MLDRGFVVFLLVLLTTGTMAQQQSDRFLEDVFAINSFQMNSTLQEVQRDKKIAKNLSFYVKMDNQVTYRLTGLKINLPGLKPLDHLAFDTLELIFENNKLHNVVLYIPGSFEEKIFAKTIDQFNAKYGRAVVVDQKRSKFKKYVWNLGANDLTLNPFTEGLAIHYASKILNKKIGWIYTERKGKGNGTMQLNLPYFEKLLKSNLTVASFEKLLPQWETTGISNRVVYRLNFKTMTNGPSFLITYSLNNYDITVKTDDTTSKIISDFILDKIKDTTVWAKLKKETENLNYKIRQQRYPDSDLVEYDKKDISVYLANDHSTIFISKRPLIKLP